MSSFDDYGNFDDEDLSRLENASNQHNSEARDWVPDDALKNLEMESALHGKESPEELAHRLLKENAAMAVLSLVHASQHGRTERIRVDASKYIVDRTLGKIGDENTGNDTLADLLGDVVKTAEQFTKANER